MQNFYFRHNELISKNTSHAELEHVSVRLVSKNAGHAEFISASALAISCRFRVKLGMTQFFFTNSERHNFLHILNRFLERFFQNHEKIREHENRGDNPAARKKQEKARERLKMRKNRKNPDNSKDARAERDHNRRNKSFSKTAASRNRVVHKS